MISCQITYTLHLSLVNTCLPALDSVIFHDEIKAARPAQILECVDLVIVVAPAFIHPSIDVGEWYRAVVVLLYVLGILSFPLRKTLAGACRSGL